MSKMIDAQSTPLSNCLNISMINKENESMKDQTTSLKSAAMSLAVPQFKTGIISNDDFNLL